LAAVATRLNFFRKLREAFERKLALLSAAHHLQAVLQRIGVSYSQHVQPKEILWLEEDADATIGVFETPTPPSSPTPPPVQPAEAQAASRPGGREQAKPPSAVTCRFDVERYGIYAPRLARLDERITTLNGLDSDEALDFTRYCRRLAEWHESERRARIPTAEEKRDFDLALDALERLARKHFHQPFDDLCREERADAGAAGRHGTPWSILADLRSRLEELQKKLARCEAQRDAQIASGGTNPVLERDIEKTMAQLREAKEKLEQFEEQQVPPCFFEVSREIFPELIVEEQAFTVTVLLKNAGRSAVSISHYREQVSAGLQVVGSSLPELRNCEVLPQQIVKFSYRCSAQMASSYQISTECLDYPGQKPEWDRKQTSVLKIERGSDPDLRAERFVRYVKGGVKVFVLLQNLGDKAALGVSYQERISISDHRATETAELRFPEENRGKDRSTLSGRSKRVVSRVFPDVTPDKLVFPVDTVIRYAARAGAAKTLALPGGAKLLGYNFPVNPQIVGRKKELEDIAKILETVRQKWKRSSPIGGERLIFLEGIEGTGKTRVVSEVEKLKGKEWQCLIEDAVGKDPVARLARRWLGLKPDHDDATALQQRLLTVLPGKQHEVRRKALTQYLAIPPGDLGDTEAKHLHSHLLVLFKEVAKSPMLIVFENVHALPQGLECQLMRNLFESVLTKTEVPVVFCASYRPLEEGRPSVLAGINAHADQYKVIRLSALDREGTRELVDELVPAPRFSEDLFSFVFERSKGSPFYVVQLLRMLTSPENQYLTVNEEQGEWEAEQGERVLAEMVPEQLEELLLERVHKELREETEFLRKLSVVGFDLPLALLEALLPCFSAQWRRDQLCEGLDRLVAAGFLVLRQTDLYQFEHQIKQQVLYKDTPHADRLRMHEECAKALLRTARLYPEQRQTLELADHLIQGPGELRAAYADKIQRAAEQEKAAHNFGNALRYYAESLTLAQSAALPRAALLIDRSYVHQMRGNQVSAQADLEEARKLLEDTARAGRGHAKEIRQQFGRLNKYYGHLLLEKGDSESVVAAVGRLTHARLCLEGRWRWRRLLPSQPHDFYSSLVEVYVDLARCSLRQNDFIIGRQHCHQAVRLASLADRRIEGQIVKEKSLLPLAYAQFGRMFQQRRRYKEALQWYSEGLQRAEKNDDRYHQARLKCGIADVHRAENRLKEALDCFAEARKIDEKLGDFHGQGQAAQGMAEILHHGYKDLDRACKLYEEGLECHKQAGDLQACRSSCLALCEIFMAQKKLDLAAFRWQEVRHHVLSEKMLATLKRAEQETCFSITDQLAQFYRGQKKFQDEFECLKERDRLAVFIVQDRNTQARLLTETARSAIRSKNWKEAEVAFQEALDQATDPSLQPVILAEMGDLYLLFREQSQWPQAWEATDPFVEVAARAYEEAVKKFCAGSQKVQALKTYQQFLRLHLKNEEQVSKLPLAFMRILKSVRTSSNLYHQLIRRPVDMLRKHQKFCEAGDILVYAARVLLAGPEQVLSLEQKLGYLEQAEAFYRRGQPEELVWGLHMLIPTYQRLNRWDTIVRCFKELLEILAGLNDGEGFLGAYRSLTALDDLLITEDFEELIALAIEKNSASDFLRCSQPEFLLNTAKMYYGMAQAIKEAGARQDECRQKALKFFDRVLTEDGMASPCACAALNDSGVLLHQMGQNEQALERFNHCLHLHQQAGSSDMAGASFHNRASVRRDKRDFQGARSDYEECLKTEERQVEYWRQRTHDPEEHPLSSAESVSLRTAFRHLAISYQHFAEFLAAQGESARSEKLAQQSEDLYKEIGDVQAAAAARSAPLMGILYRVYETAAQARNSTASTVSTSSVGGLPRCPECDHPFETATLTECPVCKQWVCPACTGAVDRESAVCAACETTLEFCPKCEHILHPRLNVCPECGTDVTQRCPGCNHPVAPDQSVCVNCDTTLRPEEPPPTPN
jgi:tetratricopeptide (TPR) repeat protein/thymidylate kinase